MPKHTDSDHLTIIGGADVDPVSGTTMSPKPASKPRRRGGGKTAGSSSANIEPPPAPRKGTKQALLIDLLKRKKGATISEIVDATGWQAHSVRGAISGTLKKRLGFTVTSETIKTRGRVYRIVGAGSKARR